MEQSPVDIATAWMSAVVAGDTHAVIGLSSPSLIYTTGQVRRYEGHEGVHDMVSDVRRLSGFIVISIEGKIIERDGVVALRRVERYTIPSGGFKIRACSFVEVEDGVVTRWADYKSMKSIDEIVG